METYSERANESESASLGQESATVRVKVRASMNKHAEMIATPQNNVVILNVLRT